MFETVSPDVRPPSRFFCASAIAHAAALLLLITIHFAPAIRALPAPAWRVTLLAPQPLKPVQTPARREVVPPLPPPAPEPKPVVREFHAAAPARPVPARVQLAAIPPVELPRVAIPAPELPRIEHAAPPIKTGGFALTEAPPITTPPAPAILSKPAGFSGIDIAAHDIRPERATTVGGFGADAAVSATHRASARTTVGGFGADAATPATTPATQRAPAILAKNAFGDATVVTNAAPARHAEIAAATTPVEILAKPVPVYTVEARALHLEGEVLLEIRFCASGEIRIARIVRGLGHGLDEAATAAAREIKFHPAKQNGAPVDSSAVVHIQFQLAY